MRSGTLAHHVALEQRPEAGFELEQPAIEHRGRLPLDRRQFGEAASYALDLLWRHGARSIDLRLVVSGCQKASRDLFHKDVLVTAFGISCFSPVSGCQDFRQILRLAVSASCYQFRPVL